MSIRLQIIVAVILVAAMAYIIHLIRAGRVVLKYSLSWLFLGILYLLFDLIPPFQRLVAGLLGISSTLSMLLFLAIGVILVILFSQTVVLSNQAETIKRLTQELALTNEKVDRLTKAGKEEK